MYYVFLNAALGTDSMNATLNWLLEPNLLDQLALARRTETELIESLLSHLQYNKKNAINIELDDNKNINCE